MTALLITIALFTAAALQARLPSLGGVHLEFLPAVVVYGALTLPWGGAIALALCAGFIQDALSAGPFGVTAIVYTVIAMVLDRVRAEIDRELPPVHMAGGALTATAASVAACCFVGITVGAVFKILLLGILSAIITPVLFAILDHLRWTWRERAS